eukprot:3232714-Rhodomonas_salina.1
MQWLVRPPDLRVCANVHCPRWLCVSPTRPVVPYAGPLPTCIAGAAITLCYIVRICNWLTASRVHLIVD